MPKDNSRPAAGSRQKNLQELQKVKTSKRNRKHTFANK